MILIDAGVEKRLYDAVSSVKPLRWLFIFTIIVFLVTGVVGYYVGELYSFLFDMLKEIYGRELAEVSPITLMLVILFNNLIKSFLIVPLGAALAIPPLFFTVANGFIVGIVAYDATAQYGFLFFLAAVLPHGVFELPAVLLSAALGIRIGLAAFGRLRGRGSVKMEIIKGMTVYLYRVVPLLVVGAVVEAFITPLVIGFVFG